MRTHREGRVTLLIIAVFIVALNYAIIKLTKNEYLIFAGVGFSAILYSFVFWFFRFVSRITIDDENSIIAPCDGKVVVIENSIEDEFLKKECIQISIFMSPLDVHMNWFPVSGKVVYKKMHRGSHLVAWAPKSSTHNERSTVVLETSSGQQVLVRQIAGAVARRVVCYAREGKYERQNGHLGFIKFGSRVDLFIPKDANVKVELNEKVVGTQTVIARFAK